MNVDFQKSTTDISIVQLVISIAVAIFIMTVMAAVYYVFDDKPENISTFTAGTMTQISFVVSILYLHKYYKPLNFTKPSLSMIWWVLAGIVTTSVINCPYKVLSGIHSKPALYYEFIDYNMYVNFIYLLSLIIIGPIIEEILNRYYAYNILKHKYGINNGMILSSVLFMLLHGNTDLGLFIFGVVFALVYEKTNNIWSSIIVHGATNAIWFTLVYFA